jgi:hypothetical protein
MQSVPLEERVHVAVEVLDAGFHEHVRRGQEVTGRPGKHVVRVHRIEAVGDRPREDSSVQCDEIWSFVGAKDKNVLPDEAGFGTGSVWTWTAIDAESKLVAAYHVGDTRRGMRVRVHAGPGLAHRYADPAHQGWP